MIAGAIAGGWLLVSGVTPASAQATDMLALRVPLTLVEAVGRKAARGYRKA